MNVDLKFVSCYILSIKKQRGIFMISTKTSTIKFIANVCTDDYLDSLIYYRDSIDAQQKHSVSNSEPSAIWDLRYNSLVKYAEKYGLIPIPIKRGGLWTAISLFNPETEELFLIFKETNLKRIMRNQSGRHYLPILNTINVGLKPNVSGEQLNLFESESPDELKLEGYKKQLNSLIENMDIDPEKVIVFGFESDYQKTFKSYIFNNQQELVDKSDYSGLIDANYTNIPLDDKVHPDLSNENKVNKKSLKDSIRIKGLK